MSRQMISYADLGPITSITTPIPSPSSPHPLPSGNKPSPHSPPRKRLRTNSDSDDILSSSTTKDINNGTLLVVAPQVDANAEWDRDDLGANTRKRKKPQRPGNPSGVPWTLHWDAQHAQEQVSYDANGVKATTTTLAYDEEDATMVNAGAASASTASTSTSHNASSHDATPRRGGGGRQPRSSVSHRNSNKWNGGGSGMNGSTSKTMPPPSPSFIGPVIPPSSTEHSTASMPENPVGSREPERKGRRKNGSGKGNRNGGGSKTKEKEKEAVSLVNEEEWDDSALIDAWNAAEEEYREMNGGKKWRCEPVKHSSLWHDEFHEDTDEEPSDNDNDIDIDNDVLQDSLGVIEETVVEQSYEVHDKRRWGHAHASTSSTQVLLDQASSSGMPLPHPDASALFGNLPAPVPLGTTRSSIMEDAFKRAQEASYTAGYWTAVYQMHASQKDLPPPPRAQSPGKKLNGSGIVKGEDGGALVDDSVKEEEEGETEEEEELLPTQR